MEINIKIKKGTTRTVLLMSNYAIKFPRVSNGHLIFLQGCYANWSERHYCKMFKGMPDFYNKVAPSFFCSVFGLLQIQIRVEANRMELTDEQVDYFKDLCTDTKPNNFGYYKGKLVCVDYN